MTITFRLYRHGPQQAANTPYYLQMIQNHQDPALDEGLTLIGTLTITSRQVNRLTTIVYPYKGDQSILITRLRESQLNLTLI